VKQKKCPRNQAGYSLLEMLSALVILFIVITPVARILAWLLGEQGNARRIAAILLAEQEMEGILAGFHDPEGSTAKAAHPALMTTTEWFDGNSAPVVRISVGRPGEKPLIILHRLAPQKQRPPQGEMP